MNADDYLSRAKEPVRGLRPRNDLKDRTMTFALSIIRLYRQLRRIDDVARVIGRQVLNSGTSVGAQYREAHRARSDAEFISKVESVLQELDETMYWLELVLKDRLMSKDDIGPLLSEADQLMAILVTSVKTVKARRGNAGNRG